MFGRRKREEEVAAEAAREAERRALFARLAERPEHICPFLGLEDDRAGYVEGVSDDHRCYAFGDPAPLSAEQQTRVCQERGYGNCPRYLRGVLVIPTEELEALRRPRAPLPEPVAVPPAAPRRRRAAPLLLLLLLLVVVGGGAAGYLVFGKALFPVAVASSSPSPTPMVTGEPTPSATTEPTASPPPASRAWPRRRPNRRPRLVTPSRSMRCRSGHGTTRCSASTPPARSSIRSIRRSTASPYAQGQSSQWSRRRCLLGDGRRRPQALVVHVPRVGQLPRPCRLQELRRRASLGLPHPRPAHRVP